MSKWLKKQKGYCSICKLPFFPTDNIERDHIVSLSKGESHKLDNIQFCMVIATKIKRPLILNDMRLEKPDEERFSCPVLKQKH